MSISKDHTLPCQPVHIRSRYLAVLVKASNIPITHIVGKDINNIRKITLGRSPNNPRQSQTSRPGPGNLQKLTSVILYWFSVNWADPFHS